MTFTLPQENQWGLLLSHGFSTRFAGTWVEGDDPEYIARLLGADPNCRLDADLNMAMRWYQPYSTEEVIWIGDHAPGWTHFINISGLSGPVRNTGISGGRAFQVEWDEDVEGVHDLYCFIDGVFAAELGAFSPEIVDPVFAPYAEGLAWKHGSDEQIANAFLTVVGRITGRFIDQEWINATRSLYRIS
ncbi:hypothetical protein N5079_06675 [Planotetraspora sp. A-T 1434]|uniref:hypothetical protein n=1 Tax=Planotetraspora sp. A-T 1434 TaxID=2979219 RepID=UPI0021BFD0C6|nr:hypothetical protein [Planotetraspora sp. A-T 1434]MCT9929902.1 hypothetical protein [Planotetraspora sp. A-T 1434]